MSMSADLKALSVFFFLRIFLGFFICSKNWPSYLGQSDNHKSFSEDVCLFCPCQHFFSRFCALKVWCVRK